MAGTHDTFNICYIRKCKVDDDTLLVPLKDIKVDLSKRLVEEPIEVLDRKTTKLRRKEIPMVLVKWKHSLGSNLSWETEADMRSRYPNLFVADEIPGTESS